MNTSSLKKCLTQLKDGRLKILDFVKAMTNEHIQEDEVVQTMEHALATTDWEALQALVLYCFKHPSQKFTQILCKVLREKNEKMTNEDIADVLDILRDPASVETLKLAAGFDLAIDKYHQLNCKCVSALGHIDSPEAADALQSLAGNSPFLEVREIAMKVLTRKTAK